MLLDACATILPPMANLSCKIPEQWTVSKIMPILKKGSKVQIENYRPIASLCSASKVFEKLIKKKIQFLENKNKLDLTGKQQHGFKRKKVCQQHFYSKGEELVLYETVISVVGPFFNIY